MPETEQSDTQEIAVGNIMSDESIAYLGVLVAKSLVSFGQVTLIVNGSGAVAVANPIHVYMDAQAILDEDVKKLPPFQWMRPILGQGKPQYAAWRNGELWEIEFEESPKSSTGS